MRLNSNEIGTLTASPILNYTPTAKAVKAQKANARISSEKAFLSYITISTGNGGSDLTIYDAKTGNVLGSIWAQVSEGYGSALTLICVNGRATAAYNQEY